MTATLLRGGYVLTMAPGGAGDGRADVLVVDDRITAIGPALDAADAVVVNAAGSVVLPGLVDAHRHLWYTPLRASAMDHTLGDLARGLWPRLGANLTAEDLHAATRGGIVEALDQGVTTVLDYCHAINTPEHAERAVDAHLSLPGRAVFGYGPSIAAKMDELSGRPPASGWEHVGEIAERLSAPDAQRTTLALAVQGPDARGRAGFEHDVATARGLGIPITAHIASIAGPANHEISDLDRWGLLGSDMNFSHCCGATDAQLRALAGAAVQVTVSPMAEWFLGNGHPRMTHMHRAGLAPAVGIDAVVCSTGDLFQEARSALMAARSTAAGEIIARGAEVGTHDELEMSAMDALATITSRGAAACFLADRIGTVEAGKQADLVLVDLHGFEPDNPDDAAGLVIGAASAADVHTVLVDGVVVKHDGRLIGIDAPGIRARLRETRTTIKAN